jgi:hypothetical protein
MGSAFARLPRKENAPFAISIYSDPTATRSLQLCQSRRFVFTKVGTGCSVASESDLRSRGFETTSEVLRKRLLTNLLRFLNSFATSDFDRRRIPTL